MLLRQASDALATATGPLRWLGYVVLGNLFVACLTLNVAALYLAAR